MKHFIHNLTAILAILAIVVSCATSRKRLEQITSEGSKQVSLALAQEVANLPTVGGAPQVARDTLTVEDEDGTQLLIMKAVKDEESGEMVATEVLDAASVTARFRNIAERKGKVDLAFKVTVPKSFMEKNWQIRLYPDMFIMEDSVRLETVQITGADYRKAQLRGYELYDRFLSKIVADSSIFINVEQLEIFLSRYVKNVYAFKSDTTFVSEEQFATAYGVTEREAVEHYTDKAMRRKNDRRIRNKDKMYRKYVKAPIVTEGLRLDSLVMNPDGDLDYNYVQTINTRPKLRKVDVILSGEILEEGKRIYTIPRSEPLTFYISSISGLLDGTKEVYMKKVVERRVMANTESRIDFEIGRSEVRPEIGDNAIGIGYIQKTLASLVENTVFDIDSILVSATASPDGSVKLNSALAQKRSESVSDYFSRFIKQYRDSLSMSGYTASLESGAKVAETYADISFSPRCVPENWDDLNTLVEKSESLTEDQKKDYRKLLKEDDLDKRESLLKAEPFYGYVKDTLYPRLRVVKFDFHLHRKGMVKDTVHTTVLDSTYIRGVQALRDMDYEAAVVLLQPYADFNTAVAYLGLDRNLNAKKILTKLERTAPVNYLLAIMHSRLGDLSKAVECYLQSCKQEPSYRFRGNLDPEISVLIKMYDLNSEDDIPVDL